MGKTLTIKINNLDEHAMKELWEEAQEGADMFLGGVKIQETDLIELDAERLFGSEGGEYLMTLLAAVSTCHAATVVDKFFNT